MEVSVTAAGPGWERQANIQGANHKKHTHRSSFSVQQVKDPVLSLQQLGSLLWHGFDLWPRNFHMAWVCQKKTNKNKQTHKRKEASMVKTSFWRKIEAQGPMWSP